MEDWPDDFEPRRVAVKSDDELRQQAVRRLSAKRGFRTHLTVWAVASLGFIFIWAVTNSDYFWPMWPIAGWGIGVFFHGWGVYGQKPFSEEEIEQEMRRRGPPA